MSSEKIKLTLQPKSRKKLKYQAQLVKISHYRRREDCKIAKLQQNTRNNEKYCSKTKEIECRLLKTLYFVTFEEKKSEATNE